MLITTLMLPGVACIYYGQEIGMLNNRIRPDQLQDPNRSGIHVGIQRDDERLPMQWDDSLNAGTYISATVDFFNMSVNYD